MLFRFFILLFLLLFTNCVPVSRDRIIDNVKANYFNQLNNYIIINSFFVNNADNINDITILSNLEVQVNYLKQNNNLLTLPKVIQINQIDKYDLINKDSFIKLVEILIKENISSAYFYEGKLVLAYDSYTNPCYVLVIDKHIDRNKKWFKESITNYNISNKKDWVYIINDTCYVKRVKCF